MQKLIQAAAPELKEKEVHEIVEEASEETVVNHLTESQAEELAAGLEGAGSRAKAEAVVTHNWPSLTIP